MGAWRVDGDPQNTRVSLDALAAGAQLGRSRVYRMLTQDGATAAADEWRALTDALDIPAAEAKGLLLLDQIPAIAAQEPPARHESVDARGVAARYERALTHNDAGLLDPSVAHRPVHAAVIDWLGQDNRVSLRGALVVTRHAALDLAHVPTPLLAEALHGLGFHAMRFGRPRLATRALGLATELDPSVSWFLTAAATYAVLQIEQGDTRAGLASFEDMIQFHEPVLQALPGVHAFVALKHVETQALFDVRWATRASEGAVLIERLEPAARAPDAVDPSLHADEPARRRYYVQRAASLQTFVESAPGALQGDDAPVLALLACRVDQARDHLAQARAIAEQHPALDDLRDRIARLGQGLRDHAVTAQGLSALAHPARVRFVWRLLVLLLGLGALSVLGDVAGLEWLGQVAEAGEGCGSKGKL
jgi:hypothetical protein